MSDSTHLAHQFDDLQQQALSAKLGMWAFLITEVLFFSGMFAGYMVYRFWYPTAWTEASHELNWWIGGINTAVLLTSSLTMALSVESAEKGNNRAVQKFITLTILLGTAFLAIKGYEYWDKWHHHHIPGPNFEWHGSADNGPAQLFFGFYFAMTGVHALHMIIGIGLLKVLWWQARQGTFSHEYFTPVENVGLYWHFVDIVWVFLYPLLYLIDLT